MSNVNLFLLSGVYILLLLIYIIYFIKKTKYNEDTPTYNGFLLGLIFFYIIMPILILLNIDSLNSIEINAGKYNSGTFQRFIINGEWQNFAYSILMIILAILMFVVFYRKSSYNNSNRGYTFNANKTYKIVKNIMYITFGAGLVSLLIFFASFGGIGRALSYAEQMRSMSNDLEEIIGSMALFKVLARLITVTPFFAIYLISENKEPDKKNIYKIFLIISLLGSVLFYLYNAGRAPIILFALCFIYVFLNKYIKNTWTFLILIGMFCLPMLDILDSLFVFFNTGEFRFKEINYVKYIYQFAIPYKNTLVLNNINNEFGLRWGKDFVTAIIDLLPKINFDPVYCDLSLFIRGENWKELGGIPSDFITFSHMQFSFIGVIAFSGIIGYFMQIIDYKLSLFENERMKKLFGCVLTVFSFFIITSFDIATIIRGQFILIAVIFIILVSSKRRK